MLSFLPTNSTSLLNFRQSQPFSSMSAAVLGLQKRSSPSPVARPIEDWEQTQSSSSLSSNSSSPTNLTRRKPDRRLRAMPYRPLAGECAALIKQCTSLRRLKSVHALMLRHNLLHPAHHPFLSDHLISQYSLLNSMPLAHTVFSSLYSSSSSPDPAHFNALIRGYTDNGPQEQALALYRQMRDAGLTKDYYTYPIIIKACSQLRDLEEGKRIHSEAEELGHGSNVAVVNALIGMYGKCGDLETACKLFDEMPERTAVSWSAMVGAYTKNEKTEEAFLLFSKMLGEGVRPNRGVFMSLLPCVTKSDDADRIYGLIMQHRFEKDPMVKDELAKMFERCGRINEAQSDTSMDGDNGQD